MNPFPFFGLDGSCVLNSNIAWGCLKREEFCEATLICKLQLISFNILGAKHVSFKRSINVKPCSFQVFSNALICFSFIPIRDNSWFNLFVFNECCALVSNINADEFITFDNCDLSTFKTSHNFSSSSFEKGFSLGEWSLSIIRAKTAGSFAGFTLFIISSFLPPELPIILNNNKGEKFPDT